jgi:hypothetical protein
MFAIFAVVPCLNDQCIAVFEAAYGEKPFGLPWVVVHFALGALLCLPMPALWFNLIQLYRRASAKGMLITGVLSFLWNYPELLRHPDLAGPLYRSVALCGFYLAVLIAWICYTTLLGI